MRWQQKRVLLQSHDRVPIVFLLLLKHIFSHKNVSATKPNIFLLLQQILHVPNEFLKSCTCPHTFDIVFETNYILSNENSFICADTSKQNIHRHNNMKTGSNSFLCIL